MSKFQTLFSALLISCACVVHAKTTASPKLSTREEYRVCLQEQDGLTRQGDLMTKALLEHSADLKLWQDEMKAHAATQPADLTDEKAVNAFNEKLEVLAARVDALNQLADRLNLDAQQFNALSAATNQRCAGMVVTAADFNAVRKEREEAAKRR